MTKARTFTQASVVADPGEERGTGATAEELMRFMRLGRDLDGMVPESLTEAPDGEARASWDQEEMERVALAIEHEMGLASKGDREPNIAAALKKAKVPMEVYLQMAVHPDFLQVSHRVYMAMTVMPRWPAVIRATTKAAMAGDVAAARWVRDLLASGDKTTEEAMRALEREGDEAVSREASRLLLELNGLLEQNKIAEAPAALVEEARGDVAVQHARPEPEIRLDLSEWTEPADG